MEIYQINEDINLLRELNANLEEQLSLFGIDVKDFHEDVICCLNDCAEIRNLVNLDPDETYLAYCLHLKKKEYIEQQQLTSKLKNDVALLKKQIEAEALGAAALKNFLSTLNERILGDTKIKQEIISIDKTIESLQSKQHDMLIPQNFSMDRIISKIEAAEKREKSG